MLLRRAIPILLIAIGVSLLAGCFYLPVPEHPIHDPSVQNPKSPLPVDFRHMVGGVHSWWRPIRPGITRAKVLATLGEPIYLSSPDTMLYTLLAERAAWIYPLCFNAKAAQLRGYALRLTLDGDILVRWELAHEDEDRDFYNAYGHLQSNARWGAVNALNLKGATSSASLPTTRP